MIVVTVELWPAGDDKKKRLLGKVVIVNDGTGSWYVGHYNATVTVPGNHGVKTVRVEKFQRLKLGVFDLLSRVLRAWQKANQGERA